MRYVHTAVRFVFFMALAHCSSGDPTTPTTFACGTMRCDTNGYYCLDTAPAGRSDVYACTALPPGCVNDPCSNCLSGLPGEISCVTITLSGAPETTVNVSE